MNIKSTAYDRRIGKHFVLHIGQLLCLNHFSYNQTFKTPLQISTHHITNLNSSFFQFNVVQCIWLSNCIYKFEIFVEFTLRHYNYILELLIQGFQRFNRPLPYRRECSSPLCLSQGNRSSFTGTFWFVLGSFFLARRMASFQVPDVLFWIFSLINKGGCNLFSN